MTSFDFSLLDKAFFDELGCTAEELIILQKKKTENDVDKTLELIKGFRRYKSKIRKEIGGKAKVARLNWNINRFYYSIKSNKFLSVYDMFKERTSLRKKFKITPSIETVEDEELWLLLAGIYVDNLKQKEKQEEESELISKILDAPHPPQQWLDLIKSKKRSDFDLRTLEEIELEIPEEEKDSAYDIFVKESKEKNYLRFIFDLQKCWGKFVFQYENPRTYHGVDISGTSYGDFATRSQIEKGIIPARKGGVVKGSIYNFPLKPEPEKIIKKHVSPQKLSEYILDATPKFLVDSLNRERAIYLHYTPVQFCESVNDYLPLYLQVGINPREMYREKTFTKRTAGPPCENSIPKGIEKYFD